MRPVLDALAAAWRHPQGRVGALILLIVAVTAIVGPWLLPDPLSQPDILAGSMPPGLGHPFGTDQLGRDVFECRAGLRLPCGFVVSEESLIT